MGIPAALQQCHLLHEVLPEGAIRCNTLYCDFMDAAPQAFRHLAAQHFTCQMGASQETIGMDLGPNLFAYSAIAATVALRLHLRFVRETLAKLLAHCSNPFKFPNELETTARDRGKGCCKMTEMKKGHPPSEGVPPTNTV
jgi:hypothetical protein